ncbi:Glutamate racemase [Stutzerimonas stutzeri]
MPKLARVSPNCCAGAARANRWGDHAALSGLVERIEAGELNGAATRDLLAGWVEPLLAEGCDTLILGCTHYPFIRPLLAQLVPSHVQLIDTGAAVARRLEEVLAAQQLLATGGPGALLL